MILGLAALAPAAGAAVVTWDIDAGTSGAQDGTGNWTVGGTTFWDGASNVATTNDVSTDIATFGAGGVGGTVTVSSQSINGLVFDTTTGSGYTLTGGTLTVGSGGIAATSGALASNVNSALVLGASLSITNNSSNTLTLGSTVTSAATGTQTLTVGGAGNTTISGLLNDGASGTLNLTKTGAGYLRLNGAATNIAGALDIQGGTVGVVNDFTATGLTGTGTFENASNNDKWTFWNIGSNQTFDGVFRNNNGVNTGLLGIVKSGTGTLTLTNNSSNQSSNLSVDAGRLVLNNTGTFGAGNQGGATRTNLTTWIGSVAAQNGVLEIHGATVNYNNRSAAGTEVWRGTLNIGTNATGAGALIMSSGSLSTNKQLAVSTTNGAYGAMVQSGGATTVGGFLAVALGGANARGLVDVSGGTWTQQGPVTLGASGIGVMNLSGSAAYSQTSTGDNGLWVGEGGTGILNVSGSAGLSIVAGNNGLQLGRNAAGNGTANLLGGTVTARAVYKGAGTGTLNFNGGTLTANTANTSFLTGLTNAYVHGGGGAINNGGNNITVGQALLAPTGNGVSAAGLSTSGAGYIGAPIVTISGGGGTGATAVATIDSSGNLTGVTITNPGVGYTSAPTFTLSGGGIGNTGAISGTATLAANTSGGMSFGGAGVTTLSGASTFTGPTTISSGTLAIGTGGSLASTAYVIANGATFDSSALGSYDLSGAATTIGLDAATGGFFNAGAGAVTLGNSLSLSFSTASLVADTTYNLFDYGSHSGNFSSVDLTGSIGASLARTGDLWEGGSGAFGFSFNQVDGVLTVSAIPEASAFAVFAGLAGFGVIGSRRRRR